MSNNDDKDKDLQDARPADLTDPQADTADADNPPPPPPTEPGGGTLGEGGGNG